MILALFSMRVTKSGRFKTGAALQDALLGSQAVQQGSATLIEAMQANTPVVSGQGRAGWQPEAGAHFDGHVLRVRVVNTAANRGYRYIGRANVVSKLHKGFIEKGLQEGHDKAIAQMRQRLEAVKHTLWVVGK